MKLNILLGKRQHSQSIFKKLLTEFTEYFRRKDSPFQGVRNSYTPRDNNPVDYTLVGNKRVVSTVAEKLDYFEKNVSGYLEHMMSVEATNATAAKAELIVGNINFGMLSTMELLAFKSYLETKELVTFYEALPARSEVMKWDRTTDGEYDKREVWTIEPIKGINKTSAETEYILEDPNVKYLTDTSKYVPVKSSHRVETILGDKLTEFFSGEISHQDRADMLARRSKCYEAVLEALEKANGVDAIASNFSAKQFFDYLHRGE